jgi:excisionase family DNA binding protein
VSAGRTKRELVEQARDRLLAQNGANLVGVTVNHAKLDGNAYTRSGYRGNGDVGSLYGEGEEAWLTLNEAAQVLGISRAMVQRWCKSGRLKAHRTGLRRRVRWDDVDRLVQGQGHDEPLEASARIGIDEQNGDDLLTQDDVQAEACAPVEEGAGDETDAPVEISAPAEAEGQFEGHAAIVSDVHVKSDAPTLDDGMAEAGAPDEAGEPAETEPTAGADVSVQDDVSFDDSRLDEQVPEERPD